MAGARGVEREVEYFQLHVMDSYIRIDYEDGSRDVIFQLHVMDSGWGWFVVVLVGVRDDLSTPCNGFAETGAPLLPPPPGFLSTPCNGFKVLPGYVHGKVKSFQLHVMDSCISVARLR